ncbi:MAG: hypothetical protein CFH01_01107 [Alphaproteobacteria bacterium MarineAlpha2_Bin1]|nr:MAG: hypothetical protein CFH01_01107 [Alphaproteobacteria bacterium MarineAlpha2_Bin1]|tara:strand:- start:234 stop:1157 length:924 start_codon:yes stop_codon:yes gene_type:complete
MEKLIGMNKKKHFKGRISRIYSFKRRPPFFLFSLVTCMIFLMSISFYSGIYVDFKLDILEQKFEDSLTIQIPGTYGKTKKYHTNQLTKVINLIKQNPKIKKFNVITDQEAISLLEPWVGKNSLPKDIIIPTIIDLRVNKIKDFNIIQIEKKLKKISQNIKIFHNVKYIQPNLRTIKTIKIIVLTIVLITLLSLVFIIITSAKTNISLNSNTIEILHLIGARKNYIAKEFIIQNLIMGFSTTIIGLIIGFLCIIFIGSLYFENFYIDLIKATINLRYLTFVLFLPIIIPLFFCLITYLTIVNNLKKLP